MTDSKRYRVPKEYPERNLAGSVFRKSARSGWIDNNGDYCPERLEDVLDALLWAGKLIEVEDEPECEFESGQKVWISQASGSIVWDWFHKGLMGKYNQGNVFATEAEAREKAAKDKARATIEHYARRKWGKFVPDWDNEDEDQYSVFVRGASFIEAAISVRALGQMYFGKRSHAQEIIDKLTPELKILFGVK